MKTTANPELEKILQGAARLLREEFTKRQTQEQQNIASLLASGKNLKNFGLIRNAEDYSLDYFIDEKIKRTVREQKNIEKILPFSRFLLHYALSRTACGTADELDKIKGIFYSNYSNFSPSLFVCLQEALEVSSELRLDMLSTYLCSTNFLIYAGNDQILAEELKKYGGDGIQTVLQKGTLVPNRKNQPTVPAKILTFLVKYGFIDNNHEEVQRKRQSLTKLAREEYKNPLYLAPSETLVDLCYLNMDPLVEEILTEMGQELNRIPQDKKEGSLVFHRLSREFPEIARGIAYSINPQALATLFSGYLRTVENVFGYSTLELGERGWGSLYEAQQYLQKRGQQIEIDFPLQWKYTGSEDWTHISTHHDGIEYIQESLKNTSGEFGYSLLTESLGQMQHWPTFLLNYVIINTTNNVDEYKRYAPDFSDKGMLELKYILRGTEGVVMLSRQNIIIKQYFGTGEGIERRIMTQTLRQNAAMVLLRNGLNGLITDDIYVPKVYGVSKRERILLMDYIKGKDLRVIRAGDSSAADRLRQQFLQKRQQLYQRAVKQNLDTIFNQLIPEGLPDSSIIVQKGSDGSAKFYLVDL